MSREKEEYRKNTQEYLDAINLCRRYIIRNITEPLRLLIVCGIIWIFCTTIKGCLNGAFIIAEVFSNLTPFASGVVNLVRRGRTWISDILFPYKI